jgi:hypothetical protein
VGVLTLARLSGEQIDIAHPKFRDVLERAGRELGYL